MWRQRNSILGYNSNRPVTCKGKLWPENEVEETMFKLLEPVSEEMIDETALLVRTPPSVETDAGRDAHAKAKKGSFTGKETAHNSTPRQFHNVSTYFPKDPNCKVCRMTKTTRARCKQRLLKRADGISLPTSLGERRSLDGRSKLMDT